MRQQLREVELIGPKLAEEIVRRLSDTDVDAEIARMDRAGARVLILGLAYKRNVDDMRESPSLKLIELIEARGASVDYHDPFVPMIPPTRDHAALAGRLSVPLTSNAMRSYDAVLIATDHDDIDYAAVVGEPTAGWIIYTSDFALIDGTSVRLPFIRIRDTRGEDMEMHPRPVDRFVARPLGETYAGKDSQLDAAVEELMKELPKR